MVYLGDNRFVMKQLYEKNKKYDIIYFDPPYGMGKSNDVIYNDNIKNWENFIRIRLYLGKLLLKKEGYFFISINDINYNSLLRAVEFIFYDYNIKIIKWRKFKNIKRKVPKINPKYEYIFVVSKKEINDIKILNHQLNFAYDDSEILQLKVHKYFSFPKPSELFYYLTKYYVSDKKELNILDAFAGSGSSIFGFEMAKKNKLIKSFNIDFIQQSEILKNKYGNSIDTLYESLKKWQQIALVR